MNKERTSVSLEPDNARFLKQDRINASGLVNKLLTQYRSGGTTDEQVLEFRIQQVESEVENLRSQLQQKQEELDRLKARRDAITDERESVLSNAEDEFHRDMLEPGNPAVEKWANKAGMTEDEFIDAMEDRL